MTLTGQQQKTITGALAEHFTEDEMRTFLRLNLGIELEHVTSSSSTLVTKCSEIVAWANRFGRVVELLKAVVDERPNIAELHTLALELASQQPPNLGVPSIPNVPDKGISPDILRKIDEAIADTFPAKYDLERLLRFELGVRLDEIAGGTNMSEIRFNLLDKWLIPNDKMADFLLCAYKARPLHAGLEEIVQMLGIEVVSDDLSNQPNFQSDKNRTYTKSDIKYLALQLNEWKDIHTNIQGLMLSNRRMVDICEMTSDGHQYRLLHDLEKHWHRHCKFKARRIITTFTAIQSAYYPDAYHLVLLLEGKRSIARLLREANINDEKEISDLKVAIYELDGFLDEALIVADLAIIDIAKSLGTIVKD